jgi:hypothetical protein
VLARFHAEADDGFLAEPLGGGVGPRPARNARRPHAPGFVFAGRCRACWRRFVHALLHERGPAIDRHVDIGDRESLASHHDQGKG